MQVPGRVAKQRAPATNDPAAQRAGVQVRGRLLDGQGGPLAHATMQLTPDGEAPPQTTPTDAHGRFSFEVMPGTHRFYVQGEGQPGSVAAPRFEAESASFSVEDDLDLIIALPFQPLMVRVQDPDGKGLAGVSITAAMADSSARFITGGIAWNGQSAYDEAASARVVDEAGTVSLFLLPMAYDLTAHPPAAWELAPKTVPVVAAVGAATEVIVFDPPAPRNTPPRAHAGADLTARVGQAIHLDGARASDPDGDSLSFRWRLALPKPVTRTAELLDADTVTPSFVAHAPGVYDLDLVVNDGASDSPPDRIRVRVTNTPPEADAGGDRKAAVDETIHLDGTGSSDPDGDPISYQWHFALPRPTTGTAELIDADTVTPSFVAYAPGDYSIELVVSDGASDSAPDVIIMIVPDGNQQPFFVRLGQTERAAHTWLQDQRWPLYVGVGAMAVGQIVYVRAQYSNDNDLVHPGQTLFDFGFNLSAYVMIDRFTDYAGVSLLQNWMLQAVINTSFDHPLVWAEEPSHYDLFGVDVPKVFYGDRRWIQLGLGVSLIVVPRVIRKLRSRE